MMKRIMTLSLILFLSRALSAATVQAIFVETPPHIDGTLDEAVWQQAAVISDFVQREPYTGQPVSEKTQVYICYDTEHLYLGFKCFDDPQNITAKQIARDAPLPNDDKVVIILDTFLDQRNGFWFEINPRGSKGDALLSQNGAAMNKDWDGIWQGRSSIHESGWHSEVAIPFKSLNFRPNQTTWGIKFARDIQHKLEKAYWPVANLNTHKYQISDAGQLVGLSGISQGIGLDIRPYALGGIDQKHGERRQYIGDMGLDLFYQITPGLKSVLTVNTDFAQTEVDDRRVNLTRFRLFFPEKRDFFLDGSNYFNFANEGEQRRPKMVTFFSRRIGLDERGTPIPILGGAKLTGQAGPWNLGLLDVVEQREYGTENFAVARVSRNVGEQSALGVIGTLGNADSRRQNSVVGADIKLATSTLAGDKNLVYYLFGLKSTTDSLSGNDTAFGTEIDYPNDFLNFTLGYLQIDENFQAGLGFVPRNNIRNSYGRIGLGPRPNRWGILQLEIGTDFDYITDFDNRLVTREIEFEPIGIRFLSGEQVSYELSQKYEALDRDFPIYQDFVIPQGTYNFTRQTLRLSSAERRRLWGELDYEWGEFWNGTADQIQVASGYKVSVPVSLEMEFERNNVHLPQGSFVVDVYRINFDLLFSPRVTLKSFIQYDDETRRIGWQSRLRWILKPGNEVLFVWNSLWSDPLDRFNPHLRDFTLAQSTTRLKLNYNYRF